MTDYLIFGQQTMLPTPTLAQFDTLTITTGAGLYVPGLSIVSTDSSSFGTTINILGDLMASRISLSGADTITIGTTGTFLATNQSLAINLNVFNTGSRLLNLGTITANAYATVIEMGGSDFLKNAGTITGGTGIKMGQEATDGYYNHVYNSGTILTSARAITVNSGFNFIENSGTLRSDLSVAVGIAGDSNDYFQYFPTTQTLINSGQITARFYAAVEVNLYSVDSVLELTNTGTISSPNGSLSSFGSSTDLIINRGTMIGSIYLGYGNDVFDGRGGTVNGDIDTGFGVDTIDLRGATVDGTVSGGEGADVYFVSDATLTLIEQGADIDLVNATTSYRLALLFENLILLGGSNTNGFGNDTGNAITGNSGDNRLTGLEGADTLLGDLGNDRLQSGGGADSLDGGDGDDTVLGGINNDTLRGGDGDDGVNGGLGRDMMFGNGGADSFVFATLSHTGATTATADTIADFVRGDDVIDLRAIDANANNAGSNDTFTFIGVAAFSNVAGQARVAQSGGNTFVELDVNGDSVADAMIRLNGLYTLNASDFVL